MFKNNSCLLNNTSSLVYTFENPLILRTVWCLLSEKGVGTLTCSTGCTTDSGYLVYHRFST